MIDNKVVVHLRAPVLSLTGYGVHSRQIIEYLLSDDRLIVCLENVRWGNCPYIHNTPDIIKYYEAMARFEEAQSQKIPFDISVQVTVPNEFKRVASVNIGVTAGIEVDRTTAVWLQKCEEMDLLIVPSEHSKRVLLSTVASWVNKKTNETGEFKITKPIDVIPEWFNRPSDEELPQILGELPTKINFLNVGQWGNKGSFGEDRKNIPDTIRYFYTFFKDNPNIGLVLKTNIIGNNKEDFAETQRRLNEIKDNFKNPKCRVYLIHDTLSDKEMWSLYKHPQITAFLSLTHGEGFCGLDYTPIITEKGLKRLDSITLNDKVLTHNGKFKNVTQLLQRKYEGEMIKIFPYNSQEKEVITLTPNHRVYCFNPQNQKFNWKPAGKLEENDILHIPFVKFNSSIKKINIFEKISFKENLIETSDGVIEYKHSNGSGKRINSYLKLTKDFGKLVGYYLSEGSVSDGQVIFSLNKNEKYTLAAEIQSLVKDIFNLETSFSICENKLKVFIFSTILSRFFSYFGNTSHNKLIPDEFFQSPCEFKEGLLTAIINGDGYVNDDKKNQSIEIELCNEKLIRQLRILLLEKKIISNITETHKSGIILNKWKYDSNYYSLRITQTESYNKFLTCLNENHSFNSFKLHDEKYINRGRIKSWFNEKGFFTQIKKIQKINFDGLVYNLSVEDDESYCTENFVVHNCLPALEAAAAGLPVIATNWSGHVDFLREKHGYIPLEYELTQIPECQIWPGVIDKEAQWAKVKEKELKRRLKKFVDSPTQIQNLAKENVKWLDKNFSKKEILKLWKKYFDINFFAGVGNDVKVTAPLRQYKQTKKNYVEQLKELVEDSDNEKILYIMPRSTGDVLISTAIVDSLIQNRHTGDDFYFATLPEFQDLLVGFEGIKVINYEDYMLNSEITSEVFDVVYSPGINVQYNFSNWRLGNGTYAVKLLAEFAKNCNLHPSEIRDYKVELEECELPSGKFATFTPGGSKTAKDYAYWVDVLANLKSLYPDLTIVQLGLPSEKFYEGCVDLRGKSTRQSLFAIKKSLFHFGIDTFTSHGAAAMETPYLVLYGSTDSTVAPTVLGKKTLGLLIETTDRNGCTQPCFKDECLNRVDGRNCISNIDPKAVCTAIQQLVEKSELDLKPVEDWKFEEVFPTISAYTTVYNCVEGGYPFEQAIRSFSWADEIVVVDGGSTDGTKERLEKIRQDFPDKLKVYSMPIDEEDPGKDGAQKALSRAMCMYEHCIQFDSDEICCGDPQEWKRLAKQMPSDVDIYSLPVYEPIGSDYALRLDKSFNIWKWRISRNKPEITHSIPDYDRQEVDGKIYSTGKSDGCFPVHITSNKMIPHAFPRDWFSNELYQLRDTDLDKYKEKLEEVFDKVPFVYHVGHVNLNNKIKLYLKSWHRWWNLLYNRDPSDPENNKYFPGFKVEDVTEEMIKEKIEEILKSEQTVEIKSAVRQIQDTLAVK